MNPPHRLEGGGGFVFFFWRSPAALKSQGPPTTADRLPVPCQGPPRSREGFPPLPPPAGGRYDRVRRPSLDEDSVAPRSELMATESE
eukprot:1048964-Prorocentrum_minimum.AAC.1